MRSGRPYSDTAARTLDRIVAAIGWNPECIHKTYLSPHPLSYLPEDSPDCEQWKRRFYDDLGGASPRAILCWGERVSRILGNRKQSVEEMRRAPRRDAERGWTLFFLWEPFYFMKKLEAKKMVWRDIRAIHQFLYGDRKK
jgi:uracil-DNA glycosylase